MIFKLLRDEHITDPYGEDDAHEVGGGWVLEPLWDFDEEADPYLLDMSDAPVTLNEARRWAAQAIARCSDYLVDHWLVDNGVHTPLLHKQTHRLTVCTTTGEEVVFDGLTGAIARRVLGQLSDPGAAIVIEADQARLNELSTASPSSPVVTRHATHIPGRNITRIDHKVTKAPVR